MVKREQTPEQEAEDYMNTFAHNPPKDYDIEFAEWLRNGRQGSPFGCILLPGITGREQN